MTTTLNARRRPRASSSTRSATCSLAEWGRKEIMLAEQEMPGLMAVREEYAAAAAAQGPARSSARCT